MGARRGGCRVTVCRCTDAVQNIDASCDVVAGNIRGGCENERAGGVAGAHFEHDFGGMGGSEEAAGVADDDDGEGVGVEGVEDPGEEGGSDELVDDGPREEQRHQVGGVRDVEDVVVERRERP